MSTTTKTYTPGPWRYLPLAGDAVVRGPTYADGSSILIAVMGEHNESPEDARLIAAAPELYEAGDKVLSALADFFLASEDRAISPESKLLVNIRHAGNELAASMRKARGLGMGNALIDEVSASIRKARIAK